ncbi:MAG: hypothetical protein GY827_05810 [Cytophagales bacterium]|nr:hypothetical protein [Cytophagales bacterium]
MYISKKKPNFSIIPELRRYLSKYSREVLLPISYQDLCHFDYSMPIYDSQGNDTLWQSVMYSQADMNEIHNGLKKVYTMLYTDGNMDVIEHLTIDRVEYCTFGNSKPFRIRLRNTMNDNYGYYYIKKADASRVYGLELEHILSPNKINFLVDRETLIEDHIAGIPGDDFVKNYFTDNSINLIRIAKEFVKFNERCFIRLLGDMRSYNYVVDITPDFEETQYRIRAIDFDQQSYEGKKKMYLPQFFKENYLAVELCMQFITDEALQQYQTEERTLMAMRIRSSRYRIKDLLDIMTKDEISTPEKVEQLKTELAEHFQDDSYLTCKSMGEILKKNLRNTLTKSMRQLSKEKYLAKY